MKTNFYILLILLFSFSVANAQEKATEVKTVNVSELTVKNSVSENTSEVSNKVETTQSTTIENNQSNNTNEVIAKSSSDIRLYLNRERNVQNISLLFPKIYKETVA